MSSRAGLKPAVARRADLYAVCCLLLLALIFCGRAVFTGRALLPLDMLLLMAPWKAHTAALAPDFLVPQNPMLDPVQQYYPWRAFAVSALKDGIIPLWNPFSYCGQPFLANLQSALFYPPNLIFLLLPLAAAFTWGAVLHIFLAGLFCYGLLRQWRLSPLPALIGAAAFMFNGYIIGWLEYPAFGLWVIIWLPAILLCYEKSIAAGSWKWTTLAGLAIGFQFLGGQLQISTYVLAAFLLYVFWRAFAVKGRREILGRLGLGAAALALGVALAAVQLLPTAELAPLSGRAPKTLEQARHFALPLTHLVLFLIPNFFGNPSNYNYWGDLAGRYPINFFETGCYVGIATLLLAWLAIRLWRNSIVSYLLALVVISLLLAVGSPLFSLFFYLAPGTRQLAGLARVLCLTTLGLAGLAAFGAQRVLDRQPALARWELPAFGLGALAIAGSISALFLGVLQQNPPLLENFTGQALRFLVFLFASLITVWLLSRSKAEFSPRKTSRPRGTLHSQLSTLNSRNMLAGLLLALVIADLFSFGMTFNPATDPRLAFFRTDATDFLRAHAGHDRIVSYRPSRNTPQAALEWMLPNTALVYRLRDVHGYDSLAPGRYLRLIGSTDWSAQGNWPAPDSPLADLLGIKYALTTDEITAPGWEKARSDEANIYKNNEALPRAFVAQQIGQLNEQAPLLAARSSADFLKDGVNTVALNVESPSGGWLTLTDTAYPGWRAKIDGKPAPWRIAYAAFRAVKTPPGRHLVEWNYRPGSFKVGLFISLAALAFVIGSLASRPQREEK